MAQADGFPWVNLLLYVAIVSAPMAMFELVRWVGGLVTRTVQRRRSPAADAPPIERLAADLRRVHRALRQQRPGTPMVRRRATREAYDALLVQACEAVGVTHRLDALPDGLERELERLVVEDALREAGLVVP